MPSRVDCDLPAGVLLKPATWFVPGRAAEHCIRCAAPPEFSKLPITDYDALNVSDAVTAIKELTTPAGARAILASTDERAARLRGAQFP